MTVYYDWSYFSLYRHKFYSRFNQFSLRYKAHMATQFQVGNKPLTSCLKYSSLMAAFSAGSTGPCGTTRWHCSRPTCVHAAPIALIPLSVSAPSPPTAAASKHPTQLANTRSKSAMTASSRPPSTAASSAGSAPWRESRRATSVRAGVSSAADVRAVAASSREKAPMTQRRLQRLKTQRRWDENGEGVLQLGSVCLGAFLLKAPIVILIMYAAWFDL